MKNAYGKLKFILMVVALAALVLAPTSTALAALNGQQLSIYTCYTKNVLIQGYNQKGQATNYTLNTNTAGCGTYKISGWWWKSTAYITPYYALTPTYTNYAGSKVAVYVPTWQSGDWVSVSIPTPSARQMAMWRAQTWVNDKVPYSQGTVYRDGYRRDCSGYISFVWGLSSSYNTGSLSSYGTKITYDALQPGDALNNASGSGAHVILFVQWINHSAGTFIADEENIYPGYAQQHQVTLNKKTGALTATDGHYYPGTYTAIRKPGF